MARVLAHGLLVPTVLVPTVLVPTVLVPTVLVPTVLVPTVLVPTVLVPTVRGPTVRVPTVLVAGLLLAGSSRRAWACSDVSCAGSGKPGVPSSSGSPVTTAGASGTGTLSVIASGPNRACSIRAKRCPTRCIGASTK